MLCPPVFRMTPQQICRKMDERSDYDEDEEMPNTYRRQEPIGSRQTSDLQQGAYEEAEHESSKKEIELIERDPVDAAADTKTSFEEAFDDIPKQGAETQGEEQRDHQREAFKIGESDERVLSVPQQGSTDGTAEASDHAQQGADEEPTPGFPVTEDPSAVAPVLPEVNGCAPSDKDRGGVGSVDRDDNPKGLSQDRGIHCEGKTRRVLKGLCRGWRQRSDRRTGDFQAHVLKAAGSFHEGFEGGVADVEILRDFVGKRTAITDEVKDFFFKA
jgi:hypothetical protein